jgi:hypothetical protein
VGAAPRAEPEFAAERTKKKRRGGGLVSGSEGSMYTTYPKAKSPYSEAKITLIR